MAAMADESAVSRIKLLFENYVEARLSGHMSGYDIRQVDPDDFEHYYVLVQPKSGVYKGHSYILELKTTYGSDKTKYPIHPPYAHFATDVFHVNISCNGGSICVDILKEKEKWAPTYSFDLIMQNILVLFDQPNNASPYNSEACRIWVDCERKFKDLKHDLGKNPTLQAVEQLHDDCFAPFSERAKTTMRSNDMRKYYKYFPQLIGDQVAIDEQKLEFDSIVADLEDKKLKKKKAKEAEEAKIKESAKPADKSSKWKKYQKP